MPSSRPELIPHVVNITFENRAPKSILDVGIGFGKYGFLFREYGEVWTDLEKGSRVNPRSWKIRIDGIESWKKYVSRVQRAVYDEIFVGDAVEVLTGLQDTYDIVFCGNVLEHMTKSKGHTLIQHMVNHANDVAVIVTPAYDQTPKNGDRPKIPRGSNPNEAFLSWWMRSDFDIYPTATYYMVEGQHGIIVIEKDKTDEKTDGSSRGSDVAGSGGTR